MKVIKSLENRGNLLKETTREIRSRAGGFIDFLRPFMSVGLPLMKNVLTPLAKSVLVRLGSTTATSATVAAIQKKIYIEEIVDIMKIVKSNENDGL